MSKITDEDALKPLIRRVRTFYHGTSSENALELAAGTRNATIYVTSDPWIADYFAGRHERGSVLIMDGKIMREMGSFSGDWNPDEREFETAQFVYTGPVRSALKKIRAGKPTSRDDFTKNPRSKYKKADATSADDDDVSDGDGVSLDFRSSDCAVLALRLSEITRRPLVGLYAGRDLHHVAVELPDGSVLDADGVHDPASRASAFQGDRWKRVTEREIKQSGLPTWKNYSEEDRVDAAADEALSTVDAKLLARNPRSLGKRSAPMLKFRHADTPRTAREFKRKYPAEFEALKGQTGGRDFTDEMLAKLRQEYASPVEWSIFDDEYDPQQTLAAMRRYLGYLRQMPGVPPEHARYVRDRLASLERKGPLCDGPTSLIKLCIPYGALKPTEREDRLLDALSQSASQSGHPAAESPYFCIGWVRYCDNSRGTWLVEEVQSDISGMRRATNDPFMQQQLYARGIQPSEVLSLLDRTEPWFERFYEDALGFLFERAAERGARVEMVDYSYKRDEESPQSVYTDLPRSMGMKLSAGSEVAELEKTWKITPNVGRRG